MGEESRRAPDEERRADDVDAPPVRADVQRQLERILDSHDLRRSTRLGDFLAYVVEETLEGRQDRIKAYSIGIEVLGRDASFDPQLDPVVRIEAGRLRRELERYYLTTGKSDPIGIEVPKGGYVPRFHHRMTGAGRSSVDPPVSPPRPTPAPRRLAGRFDWRGWRVSGTAAILALLFALVWFAADLDRAKMASSPAGTEGQPGILILRFVNLGGGPETDRREAAIAEELTARLVRFREITVVSPLQTEGADPSDPKSWPAARYRLDGSLRTEGSRLRVTARLADRITGTVLWSEIYDLDATAADPIALEQDIASRVADAIAQPYGVLFRSGSGLAAKAASEAIADSYQCALEFYRYRGDLGTQMHARVRACLQRSVTDEPNNATAWAMLSYLYLDEDRFGYNPVASPPAIGRALVAARRAVQLDPTNIRGLQALMTALFFNREPEEALRVGEQAYRLNPDDTELLGEYGSRLMQAGERRRGMAMMEAALARNPGNTGLYVGLLALGVYLDGEDRRALTLIRRSDLQRFAIYHFVAALIFARNGLSAETQASREAFLAMRPDFFAHFSTELDKRNFNPSDRAKLIAGAREAGFPVPPDVPAPTARPAVSRSY